MMGNVAVGVLVLVGILLVAQGCAVDHHRRPEGMPDGAVRIPGIKGTDTWQYCWIAQDSTTRCRITNGLGEPFSDDVFVPYLGAEPKSHEDLRIVPKGGPESVVPENGTILIARTKFAETKKFLDWTRGLASRTGERANP